MTKGSSEIISLSEKKTQRQTDIEYRARLEQYFNNSLGSSVNKLNNFAKYVPRQTLTRFICKYEIFKLVLPVHGSIVECGVFMGGGLMTWALLSSILEPVNHQRKVIGFDTFSGIPRLTEEDRTSTSARCREGELAVDSYADLEECIELFDQNRSLNHIAKVELVKGDIEETVPSYLEQNPHTVVSLLYLDVPVYKPIFTALKHFRPRIPKGGCIVFDELNSNLWHGETIAVAEEVGISNLRIQRFPFDSFLSYAIIE
jgi:Macrocin-O-methyltransferase (TylF)